ncbi:MAG: pentapeptide repeat-containing protein [Candidatus Odinarchaeia archaeon]
MEERLKNLTKEELIEKIKSETNLSDADLRGVDLSHANLNGVDLNRANLSSADLRNANFSDSKNVFNPTKFIENNFKFCKKGLIVYKAFGNTPNNSMKWGTPKPNKIIKEVVNPCVTTECGSGINVATLGWIKHNLYGNFEIWECVIPYKHLLGVVVPYNSDGKIRCNYLKLIKKIEVN